jgi:hypothetical protein
VWLIFRGVDPLVQPGMWFHPTVVYEPTDWISIRSTGVAVLACLHRECVIVEQRQYVRVLACHGSLSPWRTWCVFSAPGSGCHQLATYVRGTVVASYRCSMVHAHMSSVKFLSSSRYTLMLSPKEKSESRRLARFWLGTNSTPDFRWTSESCDLIYLTYSLLFIFLSSYYIGMVVHLCYIDDVCKLCCLYKVDESLKLIRSTLLKKNSWWKKTSEITGTLAISREHGQLLFLIFFFQNGAWTPPPQSQPLY